MLEVALGLSGVSFSVLREEKGSKGAEEAAVFV